ncbi:MAG TPA: hypothetical protein VJN92_06670 [Candidatus Acidoferrum sp.]|nr:hypothetical protein [Candidatus Acidoferrum sp.]
MDGISNVAAARDSHTSLPDLHTLRDLGMEYTVASPHPQWNTTDDTDE